MMRTPPPSAALFLALSLLLPAPGPSRPITTAEITAATTAAILTCMCWTHVGVCVWLYCTPAGCVIRFSPKVAHYNPDLVISAYHRVGGNPWVEASATYGSVNRVGAQTVLSAVGAEVPVGGGDRSLDKAFPDHKDLVFKEADVIGHPMASITDFLAAAQLSGWFLICPSETQSFFPYLLSGLDAVAWRLALPEKLFPQALIPGLREIGQFPLNTWGPVYPRHGFVEQTHATKAAAICAQRAGDVVTRMFQPHVYTPTSATRAPNLGIKGFYPGGLKETKCNTGWFQMHSPVPLPLCETFGQNDTLLPTSWGDYRTDVFGDYAWTLWRPYKCCKRRGIYIGSIEIPWPVCSSNSLLFQTALLKAEETLNLATKSCEAMEAEIAKGKDPFREWVVLSKGQVWRYVMGTEDDIVQAKEEVEDTNGDNGVPWLGGMRGGRNQDPIEVVADTVRAGYNVTTNNSADADSSSAPEGSRLGAVWPGSQDAIDWAQDVLGDVIVRTCEDCEPSGTPGIGLLPGVEKAQEEIAERLTDLVDGSQEPTRENLEEVSAPGVGIGINVELIKALRELPSDEHEILTGKLAAEAAQARVLEKTLLLRSLILSGRQVPEIVGSGPGQEVIDRKLSELDQEIDNLLFETKVRREVMAATTATILEEVQRRRGYSLGVPRTPRRDQNPYFDGAVPQASE